MSNNHNTYRRIIGIDLGGTKIYGALMDLNGQIIHEIYYDYHQTRAEESIQVVFQVIDGLIKNSSLKNDELGGIGIGVPGITDPERGIVSFAPGLGWQGFPLKEHLEKRYTCPVLIENDVNLAALGEARFGPETNEHVNLVLVAISTGIGAGVVIDGHIYSGTHHMAGEIGYLLLNPNQLGHAYPGYGAFEQQASGTGIAEKARRYQGSHLLLDAQASMSAEDVFKAARQHEAWAETIIKETIDALAQAVAAISLTYDPEVILIGGGVARSADMLIEPILARLKGAIPVLPKIRLSSLGYRGAVMGAVVQLRQIFSNK